MSNLSATLEAQGDHDGALGLLRKCLAGRRKVLGEDHPATVTTAKALARVEAQPPTITVIIVAGHTLKTNRPARSRATCSHARVAGRAPGCGSGYRNTVQAIAGICRGGGLTRESIRKDARVGPRPGGKIERKGPPP